MHVKKIVLEKFCGFDKFDIAIGPFAALVGPNNGGKTTTLRAIKLATDTVRTFFGGGEHPILDVSPGPMRVSSEQIVRALGILDLNLLYHQKNRQDGARITLEFEHDEDTYRVILLCDERHDYITLVLGLNDRQITSFATDEEQTVVRCLYGMRAEFIPSPGAVSASEPLLTWNQLKGELAKGKFGETWRNQLHWLCEGQDPEVFQRVVERVRQYLPDVAVRYPRRARTADTVELTYQEGNSEYEISASGAGLRTLLTLATAIELSDARILLFDEPDSHLHPALQRSVAAFLQDAVAENRQIIIATHAPDIIEEVSPESVVWIDKTLDCGGYCDDVGKTLVDLGAVSHSAALQYLGGKSLVYVEGRIDQKILALILQKCDKGDLLAGIRFERLRGFGNFEKLPEVRRMVHALHGVELTIAAMLDTDYTSIEPSSQSDKVDGVLRLQLPCKELENLLLLDPSAIHKALVAGNERRGTHGTDPTKLPTVDALSKRIDKFTFENKLKEVVRPQWMCAWGTVKRANLNESAQLANAQREFELRWNNPAWRRRCCPGKRVLKQIRDWLQKDFQVSFGLVRVFEHYVPTPELRELVDKLDEHLTQPR